MMPSLSSIQRWFWPMMLMAWACALQPVVAQTLTGRVVKIMDGDTLDILREHQTTRVRLAHIDAPEKGQAYSERSRQMLAELCAGQFATVQQTDTDRYGRVVGEVVCQGHSANQRLVHEGMAWVYRKYTPAHHPYYADEQAAQAARRGLWSEPNPEPPWEWRRTRRSKSAHQG